MLVVFVVPHFQNCQGIDHSCTTVYSITPSNLKPLARNFSGSNVVVKPVNHLYNRI